MRKVLVTLAIFIAGAWAWAELPVVAVAPFSVRAGLIGADFGLAEMLEKKLQDAGFPVIPSRALESWRLGQGILLRNENTWKAGAQALGAQILLLGTLENLRTAKITIGLGPLAIQAVSAEALLSLCVFDLATNQIRATLQAKGQGQGQATLAFQLFLSVPWDVCLGGFRTNKSTYYQGEPVVLGYLDPAPPRTFYVVIHPQASPTPTWTSPVASSSSSDPCVQWTWDQTFPGPTPASPGIYVAELYDAAGPTLIATKTFEIEPIMAGWSLELSFGAPEFAQTAWYQAISQAMENLWAQLLPILKPQT